MAISIRCLRTGGLEREAQRNVEVMWLIDRLVPDHKTIANFRRDNGLVTLVACRQFIALCRDLRLFAGATVAVDGSKFKRSTTGPRLHRGQSRQTCGKGGCQRIGEKIAVVRRQMTFLRQMQERVEVSGEEQVSLTNPDARSLAASGRGTHRRLADPPVRRKSAPSSPPSLKRPTTAICSSPAGGHVGAKGF